MEGTASGEALRWGPAPGHPGPTAPSEAAAGWARPRWSETGQAAWRAVGRDTPPLFPSGFGDLLDLTVPAGQKLSSLVRPSEHTGVAPGREEARVSWVRGRGDSILPSLLDNRRCRLCNFPAASAPDFTLLRELESRGLQRCILDLIFSRGEKTRLFYWFGLSNQGLQIKWQKTD